MSSPSRVQDALHDSTGAPRVQTPQVMSAGWALRRAALGLLILAVMVFLGAWLFYASIDVDEAAASQPYGTQIAPPR